MLSRGHLIHVSIYLIAFLKLGAIDVFFHTSFFCDFLPYTLDVIIQEEPYRLAWYVRAEV
jgi:hypothetical protein